MKSSNSIKLGSALDYANWKSFAVNQKDYIEQILKPALATGNWDEIEKLPILLEDQGKTLIKFSDDIWPFKDFLKNRFTVLKDLTNFHFQINTEGSINNSESRIRLPRNITNELKCFILSDLFLKKNVCERLKTVQSNLNPLKEIASSLTTIGISSFSEINISQFNMLIDTKYLKLQQKTVIALNRFSKQTEFLPFKIQDAGLYRVHSIGQARTLRDGEQHLVIPLGIYKILIDRAESVVKENYEHRYEIEKEIQKIQACMLAKREAVKLSIRKGTTSITAQFNPKVCKEITARFNKKNIDILDYLKVGQVWDDLFEDIDPSYKSTNLSKKLKIKIGDRMFSGLSEFKDYLFEIDACSRYLVQAYTGMRTDELYRMHPTYGLQTTTIRGQKIFLITTRQSKIVSGSNTVNDVYVTNAMGGKAYQLLNSVHSPLREQFTEDKFRFFGGIRGFLKRTPQDKDTDNVSKWVAETLSGYHLTSKDVVEMDISNPDRTIALSVGDKYTFRTHQLRRSLAYYLIGYELLSFPMLKQQFSHFSMAMTRWYARNANSYRKMFLEVKSEQSKQQSEIMARIYNKMANNERIGGGKARDFMKELAKIGKSYYEEGEGDRVFNIDYWQKQIKSGAVHLHAIAPNMYCTNSICKMRMNIDLSDCIECGFDLFEFATYAEELRMETMRDLLLAEELGELSPSFATKCAMQIRSAEKIMTHMAVDFEPFNIPKSAINLIEVVEVA